ncbi:tripartite tricarboxylate transporter substrate binding protein [Variovorax sp. J31P207]|uniref:Bug family tripartite tricarboxylate transporter substrate binding protein n=1 Tax=Variovorax sp. J31P207 TaxID=3053510 RepID=UPI002574FF59|nr:tripartite tricarboxylate transporter substrate binding protein [Variovorax sp. J31P207]MDM0066970.1 tripartite tricarboxylate transporter substrate binding protein [Variovorax sp. J31P207]
MPDRFSPEQQAAVGNRVLCVHHRRRRVIALALASVTVAWLGVLAPAHAQEFPSQPIKLVVPLTPGGSNDVLARTLAEKLSGLWHQSVIVENRPGASGNIGADAVARAPAGGHTLLVAPNNVFVVNHSLSPRLEAAKDLAPVTLLGTVPFVLVAGSSAKVGSVKELIELSKSRPAGLSYASSGIGSPHHLAAEMFRSMTGARMTHVPYKGGAPAIVDLLGGQVDVQFGAINQLLPHIRDGKLKALAIVGNERVPLVPDVPTLAEAGVPGWQGEVWVGLAAPPRTPPAIIERLNRDVRKVLAQPEVQARMADQGIVLKGSTIAQMAQTIEDDTKRWAEVIKEANIKAE